MLETTVAAVSAGQVRVTCGQDPSWVCRSVLDWTDNRRLAEVADFIIGRPLKIIAILVIAWVVNRLARRGVKGVLRTLRSGAVQERVGACARRTPNALLQTSEHSLRAEQRIDALASVLRSLVTFVIYPSPSFMILGEVGIDLGPLIAGAGILGVAIGFGSQSLVQATSCPACSSSSRTSSASATSSTSTGRRRRRRRGVAAHDAAARRRRHVWHVPNGEIRRVGNMSPALVARADRRRGRLRHRPRARAEAVINARRRRGLARGRPDVIEEPEVWGVEQLGAHGVVHPARGQDAPVRAVPRQPRAARRIKAAFDERGDRDPVPAADRLAPRRPAPSAAADNAS